jgi:hypothetical protein
MSAKDAVSSARKRSQVPERSNPDLHATTRIWTTIMLGRDYSTQPRSNWAWGPIATYPHWVGWYASSRILWEDE